MLRIASPAAIMALSYALTTDAHIRAFMQGKLPEGVDSVWIEELIDAATIACETYVDNAFVQRSFTEDYGGGTSPHGKGGGSRIYLRHYPIVSVTSITDDDGTTVASTDYTVVADEGYLESDGYWPTPAGRWTIVYTAGRYASLAAVSEDVRLACHAAVSDWINQPKAPVTSRSQNGHSTTYMPKTGELPLLTQTLLAPYRSLG